MSKFDLKAQLMITIFQQAWGSSPIERDPAKYVKKERTAVAEAGQLFEYLGLATVDRKSPLGWRPTRRMMEYIEEKGEHSATYPANNEEELEDNGRSFIFWVLADEVFGRDRPPGTGELGFRVLDALDLTREIKSVFGIPTPDLILLFGIGFGC